METADREAREDSAAIIDRYIHQVAALPAIPPEEEARLLEKARKGDRKARKAMVEACLPLVTEIAALHRDKSVPFLDLVQEGNLALLKAIDASAVPASGFRALARLWVEDAVTTALAVTAGETIMPSDLVKFIELSRQARARLEQKRKRPPTQHEVARELKMTRDHFQGLQEQVIEYLKQGREDGGADGRK